jgi:hypothetical protein
MRVFIQGRLAPEASEAFARSWHFIECDPVFAGHNRETLQAELALCIQQIIAADGCERDPIEIANRAIGRVREEMRGPERGLPNRKIVLIWLDAFPCLSEVRWQVRAYRQMAAEGIRPRYGRTAVIHTVRLQGEVAEWLKWGAARIFETPG